MIYAHVERSSESRRRRRRVVRLNSVVASKRTGSEADVVVRDISETGFLMESAVPFITEEKIGVRIASTLCDAEVVWQSGRFIGCRFLGKLSKGQLSEALLMSEPAASENGAGDRETRLQRARIRLVQITVELNEIERGLHDLFRCAPVPDPAAALYGSDNSVEKEDRLPLALRGWTILLSSIFLWALLLWAVGLLG